jgi:hypothetical protein
MVPDDAGGGALMGMLFGMVLPLLVLGLTAMGVWDVRRWQGDGRRGPAVAATGFDVLQEVRHPTRRHQVEQREAEVLMAEDDEDGAPLRSTIDLERGRARVVLRPPAPS